MKFISRDGKEYDTFIEALCSPIVKKVEDFTKSKLKGLKETSEIKEYDEYNYDYFDEDDFELYEDDEDRYKFTSERDDVFIPGKSPKIKRDKKHVIKIDYNKHQMILEDENGNTIHVTQMDSRLENCPIKDIINMVYDTNEK